MVIIDRLSTLLRLGYAVQVKILNLILPQRCLSCRSLGEIICEGCLYKLPKEANPYGITTLFSYSDSIVQRAIWLLKYKGVREIAKPLARMANERLLEDLSSMAEFALLGNLVSKSNSSGSEKIVIVPVPLSKERERERGFNQAEILAREIVRLDESRSFELRTDILKKIKDTPSQVSIKNRTERIKNLSKAFVLKNGWGIRGRLVVVLDDVTTTGTTLSECVKVLKKAKPRRIIKVAIAH